MNTDAVNTDAPNLETGNPEPDTSKPPAAEPIESTAAAVMDGIEENAALAGGTPNPKSNPSNRVSAQAPAPKPESGPAWKREPISNFEVSDSGKIRIRANGKPIRRPGKPRRPRPGDQLADGSVYEPRSHVVRDAAPGDPRGGGGERERPASVVRPGGASADGPAGTAAGDGSRPLGRVIADGAFSTATALRGEGARPTDDEREAIHDYAGRACGSWEPPALVALLLLVGCYLLRVWISERSARPRKRVEARQPAAQEEDQDGEHAPAANRQNEERQDAGSSAAGAVSW